MLVPVDHMVQVAGTLSRAQAIRGMAYFAGTGPNGATCGTCQHRLYSDDDGYHRGCALYRQFSGGRHGSRIAPTNPACRYYALKPEKPKQEKKEETA